MSWLGMATLLPEAGDAAARPESHAVTEQTSHEADPAAGSVSALQAHLSRVLWGSGVVAAWEWTIGRRIILGDPGFATLFGVSADEATGGISPAAFFALMHPLDRDRMRLAIGGMLRGAEVLSKDFRSLSSEGAVRWFHMRARGHYDTEGGPDRIDGVMIDITEQKRLEETLRIAQQAGAVGTFAYVAGFGTVNVSPEFCRLLGLLPAADLPVSTLNALVCPGDKLLIDPGGEAERGTLSQAELRITRADDQRMRWLKRRGEYLRDTAAGSARFVGVIYDITDAKRTEERLSSLNDTLEQHVAERTRERDRIWRVSRDLLGVADLTGRWLSVNPAWQALLGWNEADVVGRTLGWLEHADDARSTAVELAALANGEAPGFENRVRARDGAYHWLSWTAVAEDGQFYCVARDVTAQKNAAAALAYAEDQLRQSQKMEAVGQLTGGLAHDLNNLLAGITGSLELIERRLARGQADEVHKYLTAALAECGRAAGLTHRMLAFSRRQTLEPKVTDVNRLIAGMSDLVHRTIGPSITFEVVPAPDLWTALIDQNQLETALLNLCINARDAMPDGGRLTLESANQTIDGLASARYDLAPGDYVALRVIDSGSGMPADVVARAFDPFFTTKPLGQGTGLGLSMVYGFARQSGGQVQIRSEPGVGTEVCLLLPRHAGSAVIDDLAPALRLVSGRGETVLLVDDEPIVRMMLVEMMQELGFVVMEAGSAAEAIVVLRSRKRVDILVSDVGLPGGMNGRQLADEARELRPELPVLLITGYAEGAMLKGEQLQSKVKVLAKPFEMKTLVARMLDLLTPDRETDSP
jgi:PAS domain S-box-containing protein